MMYWFVNKFEGLIARIKNKHIRQNILNCGKNVSLPRNLRIYGYNIEIGNNVQIGEGTLLMCTGAPIILGDNVMFGPQVSVITGNHRIDYIGKLLNEISGKDKLPENDKPVIFEGDNWIGANSTILKGCRIGYGAVVAAGAVVTNNIPPYSVVGGYLRRF